MSNLDKTTLLGFLCLFALAASFGGLAAQAPPDRDRIAGRGFFQVGYIRLDLGDINESLQAAGLPALERDFLTLGGAGYGTRGRLLIGGEGHGLLGGNETSTGGARQLSPSGGYGLFRLGYLVLSRSGLDVYPTFGIGGGSMSLAIAERSAPTFEDVLSDPERAATLSTSMFLLDAGLAVNYRIPVRRGERGGGGFLLGAQVGYTFAPGSTSWRLDNINSVAGGPGFQVEGPYVRVSVGGWGREEPRERRRGSRAR